MNAREIRRAKRLLANHADRFDTVLYAADLCGECLKVALTAHWRDGSGQRIFYSFDEVEDLLDEVNRRLLDSMETTTTYRTHMPAAAAFFRSKAIYWFLCEDCRIAICFDNLEYYSVRRIHSGGCEVIAAGLPTAYAAAERAYELPEIQSSVRADLAVVLENRVQRRMAP